MREKLLVVIFVPLIALAGCQAPPIVETPTMALTTSSMKGYELYSWQTDGEWYFSLVVGTNRLKPFDEISSPDIAIKGLNALRSQLSQLERGEEIVWATWSDKRLSLPPQPLIDEVKQTCQEFGLDLTIASN